MFGGQPLDARASSAASRRRARGSTGPALFALPEATLLVPPGWSGAVDAHGTIALRSERALSEPRPDRAAGADAAALRAACEEMGVVLIRSAHSSNIKERRDASTGLFDADGQMVMQAEHIPVHLGAMPAAVRAVLGERHAPGVSWILNDPFAGGTHLPDITVITPVFADVRRARSASRRAAPTTPTSAGAARARCRPTAARSRRRAS